LFTVIICGSPLIKNIKHSCSHVLDLLLQDRECAILPWNPEAPSLETAVPGLEELVSGKPHWRAVVIEDADTFGFAFSDKRNPFDVVGTTPVLPDFAEKEIFELLEEGKEEAAAEKITPCAAAVEAWRDKKLQNYVRATDNPLTRLAIWLLGAPVKEAPVIEDEWQQHML